MVTATTGETTGNKRRGRPKKEVSPKLEAPKATTKGKTEFAKLISEHSRDTIVRAFVNLRRKLFNEGEPTDQMTLSIKKRISDLQAKGGLH